MIIEDPSLMIGDDQENYNRLNVNENSLNKRKTNFFSADESGNKVFLVGTKKTIFCHIEIFTKKRIEKKMKALQKSLDLIFMSLK